MENKPGKGRTQLVLLMALFLSPIIVAIIMFNNVSETGPRKTKNYGDLVIPARPLIDVEMQTMTGKAYKFSAMRSKWIMVYIGGSGCDSVCSDVLYKMRQSRLSQQGEHKRIKRLYISTNGKPDNRLLQVVKEHPGIEVVYGNLISIDSVLKQFKISNRATSESAYRLYLVDPLGNLMMSYEEGFDAKGLIKDVTLLLKTSRVG